MIDVLTDVASALTDVLTDVDPVWHLHVQMVDMMQMFFTLSFLITINHYNAMCYYNRFIQERSLMLRLAAGMMS